eukprot:CAMPEP_0185767256 /NCGR_PEP_ID=MMETSP1174-20130828/41851_1 /TAXON_ID=35687 /ORGANISM="Dictyocha speculum, Strain CCMP1381" /LENGTH=199 /DNA_ID=CAMNT_0028451337 /DNA_START=31 /DNA_END=630 /DNA_ORIENTATION=-
MTLRNLCLLSLLIAAESFIQTPRTISASNTNNVRNSASPVTMQSKSPAQQFGTVALSIALALAPMSAVVIAPDAAHAARSGGRVGGRSSSSFKAPSQSRAAAPRVTNNNYNYRGGGGGGVMIMPSIGYSPFGYSPFGGMGTGYALGAMSNNGNRQETNRLENQLGREEASIEDLQKELDRSRNANDQLEKRLDALEQQK